MATTEAGAAGAKHVLEVQEPQTAVKSAAASPADGPDASSKEKDAPQEAVSWFKLLSGADTMDKLMMVVGTIGGLGNGVCWPIFAALFARFTNAFGDPSSDDFMGTIITVALEFLWLGIGSMVGQYLQSAFWMWAGHRQTGRLRSLYLAAVLRQDMSFFDTTATTGGLLQGLNEHANDVQAAISEKVGHFLQHMTTFVAGLIVAFVGGWSMTLVMIGVLPFLAAVGAILAKIQTMMSTRSTEAYQDANKLLQQSLAQIRTVVAYGAEERTLDAYTKALEKPTRLGVLTGIYSGLGLGAVNTVVYWAYAVAFVFGAWRIYVGDYDGGQVLQVMIAVLLGGFSLGQAAPVFETFAKGCAAGGHIFRVIDRVPRINPDSNEGEVLADEKLVGAVELRDVVFAYPVRPNVRIFDGFSLQMPGGKTTALVGSSGSGKSTVVALVQRFYDPEGGVVTLDGVDLRRLNVRWLRGHIGLVSQEPTLFATTIFENIAMGRPSATQEEVQRAAELANALSFVSLLPLGFNTHVGERGLQLSGGQKQRIAIARAILKNPKILLLDEATSALDTRSEQLVQAALDNMIAGRTTIVVAHRLSTIRNADSIAVVKAGRVVELGTHKELITRPDGAYTTLVRLQMQEEEERKKKEEEREQEAEEEEDGEVEEEGVPEEDSESPPSSRPLPQLTGSALGDASSSAALPAGAQPAVPGSSANSDAPVTTTITATTLIPGAVPAGEPGVAPAAAAKQASLTSEDGAPVAPSATATLEVVVVAGGDKAHQHHHRHHKKGLKHRKGKKSSGKGKKGDEDDEGNKKEEEPDVPFSRLAALNKPEWPYGIPAMVGTVILGLLQPAFAFILSSCVALFYDADKAYVKSRTNFFCLMFLVVGIANLLASLLQLGAFGKMGSELARRVRVMVFTNLLRQEIGFFDAEQNSSGALSTKLGTDAAYIRGAVADTVGMFTQNVVTLAAGYGIALGYDWRMALVVTGVLPLLLSGSVLFYVAATSADAGNSKLFGTANQAVSDAFSSIRVVQSYRLQHYMTELYGRLTQEADKKGTRKSHVMGLLMGWGQLCIFGTYSLIIWFGGLEVDSGRADFEHFLIAFFGILFACFGIAQAQVAFPDIGKAKDAVRSIFPLLDRQSQIDVSKAGGVVSDHLEGAVELRAVRFAYPNRPSVVVFREFSLEIPAGQQVALVGESGSGKSTVVGLILRFYDVLAGQVLVDGVDVREYNLKSLRSHMAVVSQEPLLFSTTVLANILFGKPDASMDEVEAAARAANAYDFIMALPDGFNTLIGEQGVQLSGGQKQRVAIARAVLKAPRILLLDEATSALDAASERIVQDALDRVMVGRTSVTVAHRLSTIRNAHKIALVHRGHILEQGTHAELMALPEGGYARLVAAQNREGAEPTA